MARDFENDDLRYALSENPDNGFFIDDVEDILAEVPGEADGPSWHWVIKLWNGDYYYVVAWCDYTGWGCQDDCESYKADSPEDAAGLAEDGYDRKGVSTELLKQLRGEQPFGTYWGE